MLSPEHSEINELPYNLKIFYRNDFENISMILRTMVIIKSKSALLTYYQCHLTEHKQSQL